MMTFFYTDSHNDLQLMEFCSKPIAVDPDDKLKEISIQKKLENYKLALAIKVFLFPQLFGDFAYQKF